MARRRLGMEEKVTFRSSERTRLKCYCVMTRAGWCEGNMDSINKFIKVWWNQSFFLPLCSVEGKHHFFSERPDSPCWLHFLTVLFSIPEFLRSCFSRVEKWYHSRKKIVLVLAAAENNVGKTSHFSPFISNGKSRSHFSAAIFFLSLAFFPFLFSRTR